MELYVERDAWHPGSHCNPRGPEVKYVYDKVKDKIYFITGCNERRVRLSMYGCTELLG
jgi:hypothetical protein